MICPEFEDEVDSLIVRLEPPFSTPDDIANDRLGSAARTHLVVCRDCRKKFHDWLTLHRLTQLMPRPLPGPKFADQVLSRWHAEEATATIGVPPSRPSRPTGWRQSRMRWSLVAAVAVAGVIMVALQFLPSPQSVPESSIVATPADAELDWRQAVGVAKDASLGLVQAVTPVPIVTGEFSTPLLARLEWPDFLAGNSLPKTNDERATASAVPASIDPLKLAAEQAFGFLKPGG